MKKKVLVVFAHPDDESFEPGGTIAFWAKKGYQIHLVCATKGEIGNNPTTKKTALIREKELHKSARILGIKKIYFLGYKDGHIGNRHIPLIAKRLEKIIQTFNPHIILTFNLNGVSGHLDHIAISNASTLAAIHTKIPTHIYYYTLPKKYTNSIKNYFIYFPPGPPAKEIDKKIDISSVWDTKLKAMWCHKSQTEDVKRILASYTKGRGKTEYFMVKKI